MVCVGWWSEARQESEDLDSLEQAIHQGLWYDFTFERNRALNSVGNVVRELVRGRQACLSSGAWSALLYFTKEIKRQAFDGDQVV